MKSLPPAHHVGGLLERPEGRPGLDDRDRMGAELERGDDAEVAAAAADRPEQVGVLVRARAGLGAVGEDHVRLEQVVDREPVLAAQVPDPAAEREPADAGRGDDPGGRREPVLVGGRVDLVPGAAAAGPDRAARRVDLDRVQAGEVEHDAVVDDAEAAAVVAAAAHGEQQVVLACERDRRLDVGDALTVRDQRRAPVDHRVEHRARLVVAGVLRADHGARERADRVPVVPHRRRSSACSCEPPARLQWNESTARRRRRHDLD